MDFVPTTGGFLHDGEEGKREGANTVFLGLIKVTISDFLYQINDSHKDVPKTVKV